MSSIFCLANDGTQAVRILNRVQRAGFVEQDVSVLHSNKFSAGELALDNSTKVPEGIATGAGSGAILGGAIGWLAGIGSLAIPGLGPFIAAGPILAALSGAAVGGTVGGMTGGLIGLGIPEYEAQQYERHLNEGKVLIAVHVDTDEEAAKIRTIMTEEKGEAISTGRETSAARS